MLYQVKVVIVKITFPDWIEVSSDQEIIKSKWLTTVVVLKNEGIRKLNRVCALKQGFPHPQKCALH